MKKYPIALQLYSVRDFLQNDFEGTLKKVKAMGYDGVEFAGLYGKSGAEVRALCQEIGLIPISAHVTFVGQKSENMYSLIGIKDDGKKADKQCFAFRHLGAGVQNFPEILAACDECDVRWLVIEQDVPTEGLTSFECAEKSLQYLKSL
jgi:xylose isomerase domain-containing protein